MQLPVIKATGGFETPSRPEPLIASKTPAKSQPSCADVFVMVIVSAAGALSRSQSIKSASGDISGSSASLMERLVS